MKTCFRARSSSGICRFALSAAAVLGVMALLLAFSPPDPAPAASIIAPYDESGLVWGDILADTSVLFNTGNVKAVSSGPPTPATFTTTGTYTIVSITTYHYGSTETPGSISLKDARGDTVGSWPASAMAGTFYWYVRPGITIGPGTYTVVDSSPSTWSYTLGGQSSGMGHTRVLVSNASPATTTTTTPTSSTTSTTIPGTPSAFPDVPASHPYYGAIAGMAAQQVIGGYANGTFGPDNAVTRQQFAKMIVLSLGLPVSEADFPAAAVPFVDLGADDTGTLYPHEYVAVCARNNITKGKDATHFDPAANITRQQMITMVVRAVDSLAGGLAAVPSGWAGVLSYGDPTHGPNIKKAEYNGLLAGIRASASAAGLPGWNTSGKATRGEVAQVLWNVLELGGASGQLAGGAGCSFAIKGDGTLWAWGWNSNGRLGDGTTQERQVPTHIGAGSAWKMVSSSGGRTLAIKSNGTLWAWGFNGHGLLGDGTTEERLQPVQVGADADWKMVSAGEWHALAVKTNGTLWGWGWNSNGRLYGDAGGDWLRPAQIGTDSNWKTASASAAQSYGIKTDGSLWAWGVNAQGRLGDGTTEERHVPTLIAAGTTWRMVSSVGGRALAIKTDGTLWAWGFNARGLLGDGTTEERHLPTQVGTDSNWKLVSAGEWHALALKTDGSLWAWGGNTNGRLGDGTTEDRHAPVRIGTDSDWKLVSAGDTHSLAYKTDGSLWTWGFNSNGRLGDGTTQDRHAPGKVMGF